MTGLWLVLFIVLVFIPWFLLKGRGRIYWVFTMIGFGAWLGIAEAVCRFWTPEHMTLSQHFYKFIADNPVQGWIVMGSFLAGWVCLVLHLTWKSITRKK